MRRSRQVSALVCPVAKDMLQLSQLQLMADPRECLRLEGRDENSGKDFLEQMGFNDESETELPGQRQVLRRPRLAQWHSEIFNTNFENWKTVYVSEY